ncbi:Gfo/Idh/MocA family oxidoreductase [Microbacterium sp.]|jgi:predicted dehydrogenase|uniref:Gfo/Idh/MocA family protein n=1 Tax=Microbacterium sp. TaxID=51671 RepID=UPI002C062F88|nr:Gfo/Idh/MocA family oxidoreductase [Microbacterium sp.]HWL75929.1 Gfo/Idh/MocA family oxidoreductase [Microbacterium sp.]
MTYGVGVIGAGPGVAALHLPTLARLADTFRVVHIADAGSGRGAALAARVGGRYSPAASSLLEDPAVDVVAICSPPDAHAEHILAAVAAGKRAILCEKPLATSVADAERVVDACRNAGVALTVGTNHYFDPAWSRAKHHLTGKDDPVVSISVTLALPPNGRYHEVVTEADAAPAAHPPRPDLTKPAVAARVLHRLLTGLAIHDIPLVRDLAPRFERVVFARALSPIGYAVGFVASGIPVQLTTVMLPGGADALWRVTVSTTRDRLDVSFPPAFVHAGSARVRVRVPEGRESAYPLAAGDGYIAEWRAFAELVESGMPVEYEELLDDVRYALAIADEAARLVEAAA